MHFSLVQLIFIRLYTCLNFLVNVVQLTRNSNVLDFVYLFIILLFFSVNRYNIYRLIFFKSQLM